MITLRTENVAARNIRDSRNFEPFLFRESLCQVRNQIKNSRNFFSRIINFSVPFYSLFYILFIFIKFLFPKMNIFGEFAKVLSVKYLLKEEFAKLKFAKFRDFLISRNFLPAKLSALKVFLP